MLLGFRIGKNGAPLAEQSQNGDLMSRKSGLKAGPCDVVRLRLEDHARAVIEAGNDGPGLGFQPSARTADHCVGLELASALSSRGKVSKPGPADAAGSTRLGG